MKKHRSMIRRIFLPVLLCLLCLCLSANAAAAEQSALKKPGKVKKLKVTAATAKAHRLSWKKVKNADGYLIYAWTDSGSSTKLKKVRTVKSGLTTTCRLTKRKKNAIYEYKVCAYRKDTAGMVCGNFSDPVFLLNCKENTSAPKAAKTETAKSRTTPIVNPSSDEKFYRIFGKIPKKLQNLRYPGGVYAKAKKARPNMTTVTIKTWDYADSTRKTKITRVWTLRVHKNLAPTVEKIFDIIYRNPEQFPIHDVGGYRTPSGHSEHNTGTAIDINYNENYMVNVSTGVVSCGSYWKPGIDPYSIPKDGIVACAFAKYGFAQGDWGNSKDYMHFSYFHT